MICPTATSSRVWGRAIKIFTNDLAGFIRRGLQSICLMMSLLCSLIRLSDFVRRKRPLQWSRTMTLALFTRAVIIEALSILKSLLHLILTVYFSCFIQSNQHVEMYHFSRPSIIWVVQANSVEMGSPPMLVFSNVHVDPLNVKSSFQVF